MSAQETVVAGPWGRTPVDAWRVLRQRIGWADVAHWTYGSRLDDDLGGLTVFRTPCGLHRPGEDWAQPGHSSTARQQQQVLDHVPRRWATTQSIADAAGVRYASAYQFLTALARKGLVQTGADHTFRARIGYGHNRVEGVGDPELGQGRYWRRLVEVTDEDAAWFADQLQGIGDHLVELYETEDRRG